MKLLTRTAAILILFTCQFALAQFTGTLDKPVMGNWHGEFTSEGWQDYNIKAQVVAESWNSYRAIFHIESKNGEITKVESRGETKKDVTPFEGQVDLGDELGGVYTLSAKVVYTGKGKNIKGSFTGTLKNAQKEVEFELKRVLLKSPTLGMKPPEGSVVLLDDTPDTFHDKWNVEYHWKTQSDGSVRTVHSSIWTKEEYSSGHYHVEFLLPYMPNERGQGRANSGVYVLGRYEVQVLDSYALEPRNNLCGGVYQQATPITNACLPPLEWQTYDIFIQAPQFDDSGKKIKNAMLTVKHNGIVIHDNVELKHATPGGRGGKEAPTGNLLFQDHNNSVPFRNTWFKPNE